MNISLIKTIIEHINIKGQSINLAAPVFITGQLNFSNLLADCQIAEQQLNSFQSLDKIAVQKKVIQIGIDEAGRGPLLGSVNVAAAILPSAWSGLIEDKPLKDTALSTLTDSKQLSEKKRDILYPLVQQHAIGYVIAEIPAAVIDQLNILQATMLGMRLCSESLLQAIAQSFADATDSKADNSFVKSIEYTVLYDGNRCPDLDYDKLAIKQAAIDCQAWVKGDARHTSIAAASILAKVSRDQTMYQLDAKYPEYDIAKHKGYPTKAHLQAIEAYGVLDEHRRSFAPVAKKVAESERV